MQQFHYLRLLLGILSFVPLAAASPEALDAARATVKEWAAAEKAISLEVSEWEGRKELLADLIEVAAQRIGRLEAELAAGEDRLSSSERARVELLERRDALSVEAEQIRVFLQQMESRLHALQPQLPEPLLAELLPLYQRMPEDPGESPLGLGERMRTIISLLARIRKFDAVLTLTESLRTLPGSEAMVSVQTLYLGLGQAYYYGPDAAGFGTPGPDGWEWQPAPEFRAAIREAIVQVEGAATLPKFIALPVQLKLQEGGAQ